MINNIILAVDESTINLISTICTIVFFVILAFILLGGLFHMKRGIIGNTYRLIWNLLFIILGAFLVKPIANAIGNIDISSVGSFNLNGQSVTASTIMGTVESAVVAFGGSDPNDIKYIAVNEPATMELIKALANVLICYVVFLVWLLLVLTIFKFIGWLLWKLIFKRIVEKLTSKKDENGETVKRKPLKLGGFFIGCANAALIWFICLTPLTSMINTVAVAAKSRDEVTETDNDTYKLILSYADAYNNSVLGKVGTLTADKDGVTFDAKIMDTVTKTEINGTKISFNNELAGLLEIGLDLAQSGAIGGSEGMDLSKVLTKEFISNTLNILSKSGLFTTILDVGAKIAVNYTSVLGYLDKEKVSLDEVEWDDEIKNIDAMYQAVYDAGLIESFTGPEKKLAIPVDTTTEANKAKVKSMREAFNSIGNSDLLKALVPAVFYKLANKTDEGGNPTGLGQYLTSSWDHYKSINWGNELGLIYDFLVNIKKAGIDVNSFLSGGASSTEPISELGHFDDKVRMSYGMAPYRHMEGEPGDSGSGSSSLIDTVMEKADDIIPYLTGVGTAEHPAGETCLLDSDLIFHSFDKIMKLATNMITSNEQFGKNVSQEKLDEVVAGINTRELMKDEISNMLKAAKGLLKDANILSGGLSLENENTKTGIKNCATYIDGSRIFRYMIPVVLKDMASTLDFGASLPITGADLNFDDITFATEMPILIDSFDDVKSFTSIDGIDVSKLKTVLTKFAGSKVFNTIVGGPTYNEFNIRTNFSAFEKIVKYMLEMTTFDAYLVATGATPEEKAEALNNNIRDINNSLADSKQSTNDWLGENGEIEKLIKVVDEFKGSNLTNFDASVVSGLDGSKLNGLLKAVNNSKVMKGSMARIFETAFSTVNIESLCEGPLDYTLASSSDANRKADYDAEIDILTDMLDSLKTSGGLLNFAGADRNTFTNFINDGKSMSTVVYGLGNSKILGSEGASILTNVFSSASAASYIAPYSGTKSEKIATIASLMQKADYQDTVVDGKSVEGTALDNLIVALTNLEAVDLGNASAAGLGTLINTMKYCVKADGSDRAYIASELMAGSMQNLFTTLDAGLSASYAWRDNNYELVSHHSADGLNAALAAKDVFVEISADSFAKKHDAALQAELVAKMADIDTYVDGSASGNMINDLLLNVFISKYSVNGVSLTTLTGSCSTWAERAAVINTALNAWA